MKRNTKIKLLIAGSAVLSASILIPTTLASCTSQDNSFNKQELIDEVTKDVTDRVTAEVTNKVTAEVTQKITNELNKQILDSEKARIDGLAKAGLSISIQNKADLEDKTKLPDIAYNSIGGKLSSITYSFVTEPAANKTDDLNGTISFKIKLAIGSQSTETNDITVKYSLPTTKPTGPTVEELDKKFLDSEKARIDTLTTSKIVVTQSELDNLSSNNEWLLKSIGGKIDGVTYKINNPTKNTEAKNISFTVTLTKGTQSVTTNSIVVSYFIETVVTPPTEQEIQQQQQAQKNVDTLNDNNNGTYRRKVYDTFIKDLNGNSTSSFKSSSADNSGIGLPTKPTLTPSGVNTKLSTIVKKPEFFDQLISMIKNGLSVGSATENNNISQQDLNKLIDEMNGLKAEMVNPKPTPKPKAEGNAPTTVPVDGYSEWSANSFGFEDSATPTWTFVKPVDKVVPPENGGKPYRTRREAQNNKIEYKLYLTSDVDFKYGVKSDKSVGVTVTNGNNSNAANNPKVRLEVKSPIFGADPAQQTKTIYFKTIKDNSGNSSKYEFDLPTMLFADFNSFFNSYGSNSKEYEQYLTNATKVYKDITKKGLSNSATLWNQFVLGNNQSIQDAVYKDLYEHHARPEESLVISWLKQNLDTANGTQVNKPPVAGSRSKEFAAPETTPTGQTVLDDLINDLKTVGNPVTGNNVPGTKIALGVDVNPLIIQGSSGAAQHKYPMLGIYFYDHKPGEGPVMVDRQSGQSPAKEDFVYFLDLYPTGFEFTPQLNNNLGFQAGVLGTTPKLTFDSKSALTSFVMPNPTEGQEPPTQLTERKTAKIKQPTSASKAIDVSSIYDIADSGFSTYLIDMLNNTNNNKNTQITNKLLAMQQSTTDDFITKFNDYMVNNKTEIKTKLEGPEVLTDLILNNIDLGAMGTFVNKTGSAEGYTNNVPTNKKAWRDALNEWINPKPISDSNGGTTQAPKKSTVTILDSKDTATGLGVRGAIKISAVSADSLLKVTDSALKSVSNAAGKQTNDTFSNIYIYFGADKSSIKDAIVDGVWVKEKESADNALVDKPKAWFALNTNPKTYYPNGDSNNVGQPSLATFQEAVKNEVCVIFQKAALELENPDQKLSNGPAYAFYMGQKVPAVKVGEQNTVPFPVTIPETIVSTNQFITGMTGIQPATSNGSQNQTLLSTIRTPIVMQPNSSWSVKR